MEQAVDIPKNADLNTYTEFGNYISISASITMTLKNCPKLTSGFMLHVERNTGTTNGDYLRQHIVFNDVDATDVWRNKKADDSWTPWKKVVTSDFSV